MNYFTFSPLDSELASCSIEGRTRSGLGANDTDLGRAAIDACRTERRRPYDSNLVH